jgi:acyl-CoA reductase-like NAD-dependent aldehyde dehydrogenase
MNRTAASALLFRGITFRDDWPLPAFAMDNTVVLKLSEDKSLTALALAQLTKEAGFPAGAFNVVTGSGSEASAALSYLM